MDLYIKGRSIEPELKAQVRQMLPSVMADQFSVTCLSLVNVIMAGQISGVVLAGVGQVNAVNNILVNIFNSFATAGTVIIAQHIGENDREHAQKSMLQALVSGTLFLTVLSLVFLLARKPLLCLLYPVVEPAVRENSLRYLLWSMPSLPLTYIFSLCAGALRSAGSVKIPMIGSIVMNVSNAVFGFFLIIGFRGVGGYGAYGAGIAIFASRLIGTLLLVFTMLRKKAAISLRVKKRIRFDIFEIKALLNIGIPIALEAFLFQLGLLIVQVIVGTMGTLMISANQVFVSAILLFDIPNASFKIVMVTLIAQRAGAKSRERSDSALRYIGNRCEIVNFAVFLAAFFCAPVFCRVFSSDMGIVRAAASALRILSPFFLAYASAFTLPHGFRGAGDVRYPFVISVISVWVFRVFGAYILGIKMGLLVYGVGIAMGLDWLFRGIMFNRRMRKAEWMEKIPQ